MAKNRRLFILILIIILAGCSTISKYDDNETAAIVRGQEITIGDLRFLYPDDTALDYLDWLIKVKLVKQEVEEMDIDISDRLSDEKGNDWFEQLPPKHTDDEDGQQIREFAESQAKKLNMKPEVYQKEYAKRINKQNAYMRTYLEEHIGTTDLDDEKEKEIFNQNSEDLLEELVKEYEDEIEVFIE